MQYIIDRLEANDAVCEREDGSFVRIPLSLLPVGAREGTALREENGNYVLNADETAVRRERIGNKLAALLKKK